VRSTSTTLKVTSANNIGISRYLSAGVDLNLEDSAPSATIDSHGTKPYLVPETHCHQAAKPLYQLLTRSIPKAESLKKARSYLEDKLALVETMSSDFPLSIDAMEAWVELNNHRVRVLYQRYLAARQQSAPRRLFTTKSHALHFLQAVAPTKLVDGAWLYGLVNLWQDARFSSLIKIYLEELGDGDQAQNHVLLYKKLLAEHDCEQWSELPDEYFTQGTIQLALGLHAEDFIPEVIGFNLGYEQLPLHLLMTAYELKELGINPYYFTLHVTIDNVATGHARKSLEALLDNMPVAVDGKSRMTQQEYLRRVCNGYKLNQVGLSTNNIITKFNLDKELVRIFQAKSQYGQHAHADRCRIAGKTINDWLSKPENMPDFLGAMVANGWFKKDAPPEQSRFWKLIEGDQAKMFGVFSGYEKQVIYDWIAGDQAMANVKPAAANDATHYQALINKLTASVSLNDAYYSHAELAALETQLVSIDSMSKLMKLLSQYLSPVLHHTPAGLLATRLYRSMTYKVQGTTKPYAPAFNT
jgi:hypothetical protein